MRKEQAITLVVLVVLILVGPARAGVVQCRSADGAIYIGPTPPSDCTEIKATLPLSRPGAAEGEPQIRSQAIEACKKGIESDLKSPGSAVWQKPEEIEATHKGGTRYVMTLRVDSQNGMGALLRGYRFCDAEFLGSQDGWRTQISTGFAPRPQVGGYGVDARPDVSGGLER